MRKYICVADIDEFGANERMSCKAERISKAVKDVFTMPTWTLCFVDSDVTLDDISKNL